MATSTRPLTVRSDETAECCPALLAEPLDPTDAVELAAVFKALDDPVRLQLLSLIAAAPNATACSCDLEEPVGKSQPTVSHHLRTLHQVRIVTRHRAGANILYAVDARCSAELPRAAAELLGAGDGQTSPARE